MESLESIKEELLHTMIAKTPIIYIVGSDEAHILKAIRECASAIKLDNMKKANIDPAKNKNTKNEEQDDSYGYYEWNVANGLYESTLVDVKTMNEKPWTNPINGEIENYKFEPVVKPIAETEELFQTLRFATADFPEHRRYNYNHRTFVFKDIHKHLEANLHVVRRIKDVALFEDRNEIVSHQVIIVSPVQFIPVDFHNYVHVINWKMPDKEEVLSFLEGEVKSISWNEKDKTYIDNKTDAKYTVDEIDSVTSNLAGLSFQEIKTISSISRQKVKKLDKDLILEQKRQLILKNGILEFHNYNLSMDDVGGMEVFKEWINIRKNASSKEARKFGIEAPKGVLLVGIQGCGKSLFAKVLGSAWGRPVLHFDIGKVFGGTVGKSEEQTRMAISTIEATAPNIVLIDEIDKSLAGVQSSSFSDSGTTARVVGTILQWLQDKKAESFVIATANGITQLPPALLRKGRFDEIFFCGLPTDEERTEIFKIHIRKRNRDPKNFDIKSFVKNSEGFSGAEIEESIKTALITAFFNKKKDLDNDEVLHALKNIIPSINTCKKDIQTLYDWVGWDKDKKDGIAARYASKYKHQLTFEDTESAPVKILDMSK